MMCSWCPGSPWNNLVRVRMTFCGSDLKWQNIPLMKIVILIFGFHLLQEKTFSSWEKQIKMEKMQRNENMHHNHAFDFLSYYFCCCWYWLWQP